MEQLAKLLTEQLIKKGADYQKRDIYQYALEYFLSTIIGILGIITIATLSIGPIHGILYLLFFMPIRSVVGGYHAKTYHGCFFLSMLLFVFGIILYKFLYMVKFSPLYLIIIMLVIVTYFTKQKPIIHSDQPLTTTQIRKNHMLCIIFSITEYLGLIVLSFLDYPLALMPAIALIEICTKEGIIMNFITSLLEWIAKTCAGTTSNWLSYQPQKPDTLCPSVSECDSSK